RKLVRSIAGRYCGVLSREQYFRRNKKHWSSEIDKRSGKTLYAILLENIQTSESCTEDEAAAMAIASLYSWELLPRGVARRLIQNDLGELEAALSLGARIAWLQSSLPQRRQADLYPNIWTVFHGLAASDIDVAQAFFGGRGRALTGGHRPTVLIYNT